MSRSNHNYYNICSIMTEDGGECWWHSVGKSHGKCYRGRTFQTRRGPVERKMRFPDWSVKSTYGAPPSYIKKIWIGEARAKQNAEQRLNADDPIITPMKRLINLWDWY